MAKMTGNKMLKLLSSLETPHQRYNYYDDNLIQIIKTPLCVCCIDWHSNDLLYSIIGRSIHRVEGMQRIATELMTIS